MSGPYTDDSHLNRRLEPCDWICTDSTSPTETSMSSLRSEINERFISLGEYDRISATLAERLQACGWFDHTKLIASKLVREGRATDFESLLQAVSDGGLERIPDEIRSEILWMIKLFLQTIVHVER